MLRTVRTRYSDAILVPSTDRAHRTKLLYNRYL